MNRVPSGYAMSYPRQFAEFRAGMARAGMAEAVDLPVMTQKPEDDFLRGAEAAEIPEHGEKFTEVGIVPAMVIEFR